MAAGMGSRYGGLKQLDSFGPNSETLIEYSLYDAKRAGFNKFVFIIRPDIEALFREKILSRIDSYLDVSLAFQTVTSEVSDSISVPSSRKKPWGTAHAVLVSKEHVTGDFGVINADDFYGMQSYVQLASFLKEDNSRFCLVGYRLKNTLSEFGHVARGVCEFDEGHDLRSIDECTQIEKTNSGQIISGNKKFSGDELVSMNMWGLRSRVWPILQEGFEVFLSTHSKEEKAEYFLPVIIQEALRAGKVNVDVLVSEEPWYGVTYKDDSTKVKGVIADLIAQGVYPETLWG